MRWEHSARHRAVAKRLIFASASLTGLGWDVDQVLAERFPLSSMDCSSCYVMDSDHFTIIQDANWDIAKKFRCFVSLIP